MGDQADVKNVPDVTDVNSSHVFLLVLAVLSYRLLFHTTRHLNFFSLVLCVACAYSTTQIAGFFCKLSPVVVGDLGTHTSVHMLSRLSAVAADKTRQGCEWAVTWVCSSGLLDTSMRAKCSEGLDWMHQAWPGHVPMEQHAREQTESFEAETN